MSYLEGSPDLADFIQEFVRHKVSFMVVGGHAVGFHSKPRATKDLDVWIESTKDNRQRAIDALIAYGAPAAIGKALEEAKEDEIVWFGRPPNRIDILQHLPGLHFVEASRRIVFAESGTELIPIIGLEDLIRNKECVNRDQDQVDVKALRRRLR